MPSCPGKKVPSAWTPTYDLLLMVSMCSAWVASVPNKQIKIRQQKNNILLSLHTSQLVTTKITELWKDVENLSC